MKNSKSVLSVKFNSTHSPSELMSVCKFDLGLFKKVAGLIQKYYIIEEVSGALSGLYFFESKADRAAFLASDLAKGIPARYGVIPDTLRVEEYDTAITLNSAA